MPGNCETCNFHNEIDIKLKHIAEGIDRLEQDKQRQWDRLDEHSNAISSLKAVIATVAFALPVIGGIVGYFLGRG